MQVEIQIREAVLEDRLDAAAIVALIDAYASTAAGQSARLDRQVKENLISGLRSQPQMFTLLAFVDSRPVGLAVCINSFSTFAARRFVNVHDLAVDPEYQSRGIGRALLGEVALRARESGACKVTLEVHDSNEGAKRLYQRLGFGPWDRATLYLTKVV